MLTWKFNQSIGLDAFRFVNNRRDIERRYVNREEFREQAPDSVLSLENEQADARRDGRTRFARPTSQARTETDREMFIFSVQLMTSRIDNLTNG